MTWLCWICGREITRSATSRRADESYYLEVRLVTVNRPYSKNNKSGIVKICHKCAKDVVGLTHEGENLN